METWGGERIRGFGIFCADDYQAREEHQRKLEEARSKHKEWWNLDEQGRTVGKRAEQVNEAGLARREENRVDDRGVTRGGIYRGT